MTHHYQTKELTTWFLSGSVPSLSPERTNEAVEKAKHLSTIVYYAYQVHITSMQSVRSILAHGGEPIDP
jgi:hypothetical protein